MLDRALNSVASIYRDVAVLQNNAEDGGTHQPRKPFRHHGIVGTADRAGAVRRRTIATARRIQCNGNPVLVFEALFCALIP